MKWNQKLSNLEKGTRQGGLTSPYLFNLFYQGLAGGLTETPGGLKIKRNSFVSTTLTELQNLIDYANYANLVYGLQFNTSKTTCVTFRKSHLKKPRRHLNGIEFPGSTWCYYS